MEEIRHEGSDMVPGRHIHRSTTGVAATWIATGVYVILGYPGAYIRRRAGGWRVFGLQLGGSRLHRTLSSALESIAPDAHLSGRG